MNRPVHVLLLIALSPAASMVVPADARAQATRTLYGVVRDSASSETLPYATVSLRDQRASAFTNFDGRFTLLGVPVGPLVLRVEALGYAPADVPVEASTETRFMEVRLRRQAIGLDTIQVAHGQAVDVVRDISRMGISPRLAETLPSIGEVDLFRALQLLPGVAATGDGAGLHVRGGTPDQNLVLFDGMTVYHVDHFFGLFSAFNADAVKDVSAFTGGFPARYGGRVSGVLDLTGRTGDEQRFRIGTGVNLLSGRLVAEVPIGGRGSWLIAGRRSYTDILNTPLYTRLFDFRSGFDSAPTTGLGGSGQIFQLRPDFFFYDLNSKLSYRPSQRDLVSLSLYRGSDRLDQSVSSGPAGAAASVGEREHLTDWGNQGVSGRWAREWNHRVSSDLLVATSRYFSNDVNISAASGRREENEVDDFSVRLDAELRATRRLTFGVGTWLTESSVSYEFARLTDDSVSLAVDRTATGRLAGGYAEATMSVADRLDLTAGLRATHYDLTGTVYNEPRASFRFTLTDRLQLKAAWGLYHQFVTRVENEDVLQGSRDFWLLADDELLPVRSEHRIAGATYEADRFLLNLEAYEKTFDNLTLFSTRYRRDPLADPAELFLTGSGRARGVEMLAQKLTGPLTGWIGYTLAQVAQSFPDIDDGAEFPAGHDQTHSIKAVGMYEVGRWKVTTAWVFGSGRPYTAPQGQYFLTMLDGEVRSYIGVGEKNELRFPAYHRLDLAAFRRFEAKRFEFELGLSIFNIYNRNNLWYRQFDLSQQPITITDVGMLGFTPSIDLKFSLK